MVDSVALFDKQKNPWTILISSTDFFMMLGMVGLARVA